MTPTTEEIFGLTEHEIKRIISAYLEGAGRPCTREEIDLTVDELQAWKIDKVFFDAVISGAANLKRDDDGELSIIHPDAEAIRNETVA